MKTTILSLLLYAFIASSTFAQETTDKLKLVNISCRAYVGENSFIAGFAIQTERRVLIRAVGPSLNSFNVSGVCKDPILTLYNNQMVVAENNDWDNRVETSQVFAQAGAFPLNTQTKDAVIVITLAPGIYTAVMTCAMGEEGIALLEVYDLDWRTPGGLSNLSMRGAVGTGDKAMVPGIVIGGLGDGNFLFRAVGPGLDQFGIKNYIPDPKLILNLSSNFKMENDNWQTTFSNYYFSTKGAFPLPNGSRDAALLYATRRPNGPQNATSVINAHIEDSDGIPGIVLFEVFSF